MSEVFSVPTLKLCITNKFPGTFHSTELIFTVCDVKTDNDSVKTRNSS